MVTLTNNATYTPDITTSTVASVALDNQETNYTVPALKKFEESTIGEIQPFVFIDAIEITDKMNGVAINFNGGYLTSVSIYVFPGNFFFTPPNITGQILLGLYVDDSFHSVHSFGEWEDEPAANFGEITLQLENLYIPKSKLTLVIRTDTEAFFNGQAQSYETENYIEQDYLFELDWPQNVTYKIYQPQDKIISTKITYVQSTLLNSEQSDNWNANITWASSKRFSDFDNKINLQNV